MFNCGTSVIINEMCIAKFTLFVKMSFLYFLRNMNSKPTKKLQIVKVIPKMILKVLPNAILSNPVIKTADITISVSFLCLFDVSCG